MNVSCIVLAGGKSTRLGRNKLAENIGNRSLLERVVSKLTIFNEEIIVVTAKDSSIPQLNNDSKLKIVNDIYPGKGSLGGLYTGLVSSMNLYNLVVACDMPFLNIDLLQYMVSLSGDYDAVLPRVNKSVLEPLHAVYSRNCISPLEALIKENKLSILELFPMIRVRYLDDEEIDWFDPQHRSFFNINTEADLIAGKEIAGKEGFY